jgi:hypothetical protein
MGCPLNNALLAKPQVGRRDTQDRSANQSSTAFTLADFHLFISQTDEKWANYSTYPLVGDSAALDVLDRSACYCGTREGRSSLFSITSQECLLARAKGLSGSLL